MFLRSVGGCRPAVRQAVREELRAQIELLLDLGAPLGHLNGHQYIECLPLISGLIPELAQRYSLREVRIAWEPGLTGNVLLAGRPVAWLLAQVLRLPWPATSPLQRHRPASFKPLAKLG